MKPFISGLVMVLLLGTVPAGAQEEDDDAGLNIVPLVNPDAPRLAVWFVAQPGIALEDASAVESQVFESLLNRRDVRLSRALVAPLSREAGGWGRCDEAVFATTDDPDFKALMATKCPGDRVKFVVKRGERTKRIKVKLGARPKVRPGVNPGV